MSVSLRERVPTVVNLIFGGLRFIMWKYRMQSTDMWPQGIFGKAKSYSLTIIPGNTVRRRMIKRLTAGMILQRLSKLTPA